VSSERRHAEAFFHGISLLVHALLLISIAATIYAAAWEYSTRRYLKGFSDAIVPGAASADQKAQAILDWMSRESGRIESRNGPSGPDRNPIDTVNYKSLLRVCGTATNAFINLADSAGLSARRLLLLDAEQRAKHVDAEVLMGGRWVVVDPLFRVLLRGPDGSLLTRTQLLDPNIFSTATRRIQNYNPNYTFDRTAHVRVARLGATGLMLGKLLHRSYPGLEDSTFFSLLLERESLAFLLTGTLIIALLVLLRISLRWYGEQHLQIEPDRMRERLRRAALALIDTQN
jgi:hypothetical protein